MDKVLVLGGTGMVGHAMFVRLSAMLQEYEVYAAVRYRNGLRGLPDKVSSRILEGVDVYNMDRLTELLSALRPSTIINCIGLTKRLPDSGNLATAIFLNSLHPHRLALLCQAMGIRLIHFSTDCVFEGSKGFYDESDIPDAADTYGRTKTLGEVTSHDVLTIRTSMIGHELKQKTELLEWFLGQKTGPVRGYRRAIYSGVTTLEMARIIGEFVLPRRDLTGLYHISSDPVNKFDLLGYVAREYGMRAELVPMDEPVLDRSLDSSKFRKLTGYRPRSWEETLAELHEYRLQSPWYEA